MRLDIDPAEFAEVIQAAVDRALAKMRDDRRSDDTGKLLLGKREAAEALSVSPSTIDRLRREAGLPFIRLQGVVLFRRQALEEWAAAKETAK